MKGSNLSILSWKMNSFRCIRRTSESYKTGAEDGALMSLHDYQCFYLPTNKIDNTRCLQAYVRINAPFAPVTTDSFMSRRGLYVYC